MIVPAKSVYAARATNKELGDLHGKITTGISQALDEAGQDPKTLAIAIAWMKHNQVFADPDQDAELKALNERLQARRTRVVPTISQLEAEAARILGDVE